MTSDGIIFVHISLIKISLCMLLPMLTVSVNADDEPAESTTETSIINSCIEEEVPNETSVS